MPRTRYAASTAVGKAMSCHQTMNYHFFCLLIGRTGTTYTFYEIEKQKETIKETTKTKKDKSKEKNNKMKANVPTLGKERAGKKGKYIENTTACKHSKRQRTKEIKPKGK